MAQAEGHCLRRSIGRWSGRPLRAPPKNMPGPFTVCPRKGGGWGWEGLQCALLWPLGRRVRSRKIWVLGSFHLSSSPSHTTVWPTVISLGTVRTWISQNLSSTFFSLPRLALYRVKAESGPGLQSPHWDQGKPQHMWASCSSQARYSAFSGWPFCAGLRPPTPEAQQDKPLGSGTHLPHLFPSHPKVRTGSKEN